MADKENNTAGEQNKEKQDAPVFQKGITLDKLMSKFENKLNTEKAKTFEKAFAAKYKQFADAQAIAENFERELEKMFTEFNEGL